MADTSPCWYIRGPNESHAYDPDVPVLKEYVGQVFCRTCEVVHRSPIGPEWHIEGPDVDRMLCGVVIGLEDGEVRVRPTKNVCPRCLRKRGW